MLGMRDSVKRKPITDLDEVDSRCIETGIRLAKNAIGDADDMIQNYENKLAEIKQAFQHKVILNISITVMRFVQRSDLISMFTALVSLTSITIVAPSG
jgi:hypothetical protein